MCQWEFILAVLSFEMMSEAGNNFYLYVTCLLLILQQSKASIDAWINKLSVYLIKGNIDTVVDKKLDKIFVTFAVCFCIV